MTGKDEHHGEFDPHRGYQEGKNTRFNREWYDALRASKGGWKMLRTERVHPNRGIPLYVDAGQTGDQLEAGSGSGPYASDHS